MGSMIESEEELRYQIAKQSKAIQMIEVTD